MSVYATIEGSIHYNDKPAYDEAVKILKDGGWVSDSGEWLEETGHQTGENALDDENLTIYIPRSHYRNLLHVSNKLLNGANADVKWASTDGMFEGGYFGKESIDLAEWAKENGLESEPKETEFKNDDDYYQAYSDWQESVCDAFMDDE